MCLLAQVPDAMEYLLAEFNRVCIYTVPKHLHALNVSLNLNPNDLCNSCIRCDKKYTQKL